MPSPGIYGSRLRPVLRPRVRPASWASEVGQDVATALRRAGRAEHGYRPRP